MDKPSEEAQLTIASLMKKIQKNIDSKERIDLQTVIQLSSAMREEHVETVFHTTPVYKDGKATSNDKFQFFSEKDSDK
jgi:hypothetical protein